MSELRKLVEATDIRDRAFGASMARLELEKAPKELAALYDLARRTALSHHARVRRGIKNRTLNADELTRLLQAAPFDLRDHLAEEILDIAYPPLELRPIAREATGLSPSGVDQILFALSRAELGPEKTFVDLGSGLGKVVLFAALLTGARAIGIEIDAALNSIARHAAESLALDNAVFLEADVREVPLPAADVYYMYIPLTRSADLVTRLEPIARERKIVVFSQALDLERFPWLRSAGAASYWLETYESAC